MVSPLSFEIAAELGVAAGLAAGGSAYAALWPASQIFGKTLLAPARPGELALTFDDGPNPLWTPRLLEILDRHKIRASFFMVGRYAQKESALVREMATAGHLIGNHSWSQRDPRRNYRRSDSVFSTAFWGASASGLADCKRVGNDSRTLERHDDGLERAFSRHDCGEAGSED